MDNEENYCASDVNLNSNCAIGFYSDMCRVCKEDYLVGVGYICMPAPSFSCDEAS